MTKRSIRMTRIAYRVPLDQAPGLQGWTPAAAWVLDGRWAHEKNRQRGVPEGHWAHIGAEKVADQRRLRQALLDAAIQAATAAGLDPAGTEPWHVSSLKVGEGHETVFAAFRPKEGEVWIAAPEEAAGEIAVFVAQQRRGHRSIRGTTKGKPAAGSDPGPGGGPRPKLEEGEGHD